MSDVATAPQDLRVRPMLRNVLSAVLARAPYIAGGAMLSGTSVGDTMQPLNSSMGDMIQIEFGESVTTGQPQLTGFMMTSNASTANMRIGGSHSFAVGQPPIADVVRRLFEFAEDERFDDGVNSNLRVGLGTLLVRFPTEAIKSIRERLSRPLSTAVIVETLHAIGNVDGRPHARDRLLILAEYLSHPSPLLRDAAATGLSYLRDPEALPFLRKAIGYERNSALRNDMEAVAAELERHAAGAT